MGVVSGELIDSGRKGQVLLLAVIGGLSIVYVLCTSVWPYVRARWRVAREKANILRTVKNTPERSVPETPASHEPDPVSSRTFVAPTLALRVESLPRLTRKPRPSSIPSESRRDDETPNAAIEVSRQDPPAIQPSPSASIPPVRRSQAEPSEIVHRRKQSRQALQRRIDAALKAEQDAAYAEAVARDLALEDARQAWMQRQQLVAALLPAEPAAQSAAVTVSFKLHLSSDVAVLCDTSRGGIPAVSRTLRRRFLLQHSVAHLLLFIESSLYSLAPILDTKLLPIDVTLAIGYPPQKFQRSLVASCDDLDQPSQSLQAVGIEKDCVVWVSLSRP